MDKSIKIRNFIFTKGPIFYPFFKNNIWKGWTGGLVLKQYIQKSQVLNDLHEELLQKIILVPQPEYQRHLKEGRYKKFLN